MNIKRYFSVKKIALIGMLSAVVFVANYIQIKFSVGTDVTRIHFGNAACLLSGLLLGGPAGGFAAGIGSFIFDLFDPKFAATAYITLIFKFVLGFTCGVIAFSGKREGESFVFNLIGAIAGSIVYIILYLGKAYISTAHLLENPGNTVFVDLLTKLGTSSVNAVAAVLVSIPLSKAIRVALRKNKLTL